MSYYLISIGGTGARCLEAFVNINGAGLLKDSQDVELVFVDADKSCGNLTKTQETAELYNKIQNLNFGDNGLFKNKIIINEAWSPVPDDCDNLDVVFERVGLSNKEEYKSLSLLYDSLFTEQERKTDLDKGFRGHPAIGAAVMSQSMDTVNSKVWKTLTQKINTDKDARVFLFASVFGGTGAAGFPTIARILHNSLKKGEDGKSVANIGGVLVLPYFQFPPSTDEMQKEMQAKVSEFMINTKAALDYYRKSDLLDNIFKSIYLIGDNDLNDVGNFSLGSTTQKNEANFIELYAALAAVDFFNKKEFSNFESPMCARADGTNKIEWEDLPDCNADVRKKLQDYIKFLGIYKNFIYEILEEDRKIPIAKGFFKKAFGKKRIAWEETLLQKAGNVDIADNDAWNDFVTMKEYSNVFFSWLEQVTDNKKRQIDLVDKQIFEDKALRGNFDYNSIVKRPDINEILTEKQINQKLAGYSVKDANVENNNGIGILLNAVYKICK